MTNCTLNFTNPWLLLLIIPAVAITLIPYFRLNKRYRKNRNRIGSIVLHSVAFLLSILMLAGLTFDYQIPNEKNEIILLVDVSDTEEQSAEKRDEFVKTVLNASQFDGYRVGVVTFGYDQVYAVPLTTEIDEIYDAYEEAEKPDTTATDIAAALTYTKDLFKYPQSSKIVLITDGKETDESCRSVIKSVYSMGIKLTSAYVGSSFPNQDVQITDVELPDRHIVVGDQVSFNVNVSSKMEALIRISIWDEDNVIDEERKITMVGVGEQSFVMTHTFSTTGLHELKFIVEVSDDFDKDQIAENDVYTTYVNLEVFNKVLVIERKNSQESNSKKLEDMLRSEELYGEGAFDITNALIDDNYSDCENLPVTIEGLCAYDLVIINNVATRDMLIDGVPKELIGITDDEGDDAKGGNGKTASVEFDTLLHKYVNDFGGGLLTVGGDESETNNSPHIYDVETMKNKLFQKLLPVQVENITPPLGLMLVVDSSGSMSSATASSNLLDCAVTAAMGCLDGLNSGDYMGVMTLGTSYQKILPMTKVTERDYIKEKIKDIKNSNGSTTFTDAIQRAGEDLMAVTGLAKRHMIVITDGGVNEAHKEDYYNAIKDNYTKGITMSFAVLIGAQPLDDASKDDLRYASEDLGGGRLIILDGSRGDIETQLGELREDLKVEDLKTLSEQENIIYPIAVSKTSPLMNGMDEYIGCYEKNSSGEYKLDKDGNRILDTSYTYSANRLQTKISGFYGSRIKSTATSVIVGEYNIPIYAQWQYGNGKVGSFMIDLLGEGNSKTIATDDVTGETTCFLDDAGVQKFIYNVLNNLMPTANIRQSSMKVTLTEDNYTNKLGVITELKEGEKIVAEITCLIEGKEKTISLNSITAEEERDTQYVTTALSEENNYSRSWFVLKDVGLYKITVNKVDKDGKNVEDPYETYKAVSYSQEYNNLAESEDDILKQQLSEVCEMCGGVLIEDNEDPIEIFEDFITKLDRTFDPRWLFGILAIIFFLGDIAIRKFKFKWPHEIIRERKKLNKK